MPRTTGDGRPPMAIAMQWVQQITSIGLEMVLPAGLGWWLDEKWGTSPWLLVAGAILGFAVSMMHLLQLAKAANQQGKSGDSRKQ